MATRPASLPPPYASDDYEDATPALLDKADHPAYEPALGSIAGDDADEVDVDDEEADVGGYGRRRRVR
jgi:hypothetical protein